MASNNLIIRSATRDDAMHLSVLAQRVFINTYGAVIPPHIAQSFVQEYFSAAVFTHLLTHSTDQVVVAMYSDQIIGYLRLTESPLPECVPVAPTLELAQLYLDQAHHGRGTGAALLHAACSYAQSTGAKAIWLCAWEQNRRAIRFYEKWGFTTVGHCMVAVDQVMFEDLVMLRTLPG